MFSTFFFFFFKQKTAYEMRISDWSSDVCSSDLIDLRLISPFADAFGGERESLDALGARPAEPRRLGLVAGDDRDLVGPVGCLGRFGQRHHVRSAPRDKDGDFGLIHIAFPQRRPGSSSDKSEEHTSELQSLMPNSYA